MKYKNPYPRKKWFTIKVNGAPVRFLLYAGEEVDLTKFGFKGNDIQTADELLSGKINEHFLIDAHQDAVVHVLDKNLYPHPFTSNFDFNTLETNAWVDEIGNPYVDEAASDYILA